MNRFDISGISVMLGMPVHRDIAPQTVRSLLETQQMCMGRGIVVDIELKCGSSLVHVARSQIAQAFLQSERNRLFWVDSDISWKAEDFFKLIVLSTVMDCVGAIYPAKLDPIKFFLSPDPFKPLVIDEWGCLPIGGMGLGFTIVTRKVIEHLALTVPIVMDKGSPRPRLFRCDVIDGEDGGEDIAFFEDIRALGYQVNLEPSIELGHVGAKEYRASILDHLARVTPDTAEKEQ